MTHPSRASSQRCQQAVQFVGDLSRILQGATNFRFDQVAEAAAQTMDCNFDHAFIEAELTRGIGLGEVFNVTCEPRLEDMEMFGFSGGLVFFS